MQRRACCGRSARYVSARKEDDQLPNRGVRRVSSFSSRCDFEPRKASAKLQFSSMHCVHCDERQLHAMEPLEESSKCQALVPYVKIDERRGKEIVYNVLTKGLINDSLRASIKLEFNLPKQCDLAAQKSQQLQETANECRSLVRYGMIDHKRGKQMVLDMLENKISKDGMSMLVSVKTGKDAHESKDEPMRKLGNLSIHIGQCFVGTHIELC